MGHLTALKDLRQKGFVIPGSDGTVPNTWPPASRRGTLNIPEPTRSAPKSGS